MALSVKTGKVECPASTGNLAFTGIGFQPKGGIFWLSGNTADGEIASSAMGIGMAQSSTAEAAVSGFASDNEATTSTGVAKSNVDCIKNAKSGSAGYVEADFITWDVDGFTLNFSVVTSGVDIFYFVFAGSDIDSVAVTHHTMKTSTGDQGYTGIGFQPDFCLFIWDTRSATDEAYSSNCPYGMGAATAATEEFSQAFSARDSVAAAEDDSHQRTDSSIIGTNVAGAQLAEADFKSMDADGFTLTWSDAAPVAYDFHVLSIKGGQHFVGTFNLSTSTGDQGVTGVGFEPSAVMFSSAGAATAASNIANWHHSLGVGVSSTERGSICAVGEDAADPTVESMVNDQTSVIQGRTPGSPSSEDALADYGSNDADGFTIDNETADASPVREVVYWAIGAAAVADQLPDKWHPEISQPYPYINQVIPY